MLFNSGIFIFFFLPIIVTLYWAALPIPAVATGLVLFASLVFYGWGDYERLIPIISLSIAFNFLIGRLLQKRPNRYVLVFGVIVNLIVLAYFKYTTFLLNNINNLFTQHMAIPVIVLPIGISFFTFTQLAFLVDTYRGEAKEYRLDYYGLFVTFFPHLIAGPILHHKEMIPQFMAIRNRREMWRSLAVGITYFSFGLFKKMIIADNVQPFVNFAFNDDVAPRLVEAWIGALAYTFQLYFDFSGYSDMAIGLARMFGISFPLNFDSPYKSKNIIEFWRRWHMTLSRFLRDYLYIPLGGNRSGLGRGLNIFVTMTLGGLWHGAGWTFIIWGGLHGIFLILNHCWIDLRIRHAFRVSRWLHAFVGVAAQILTFSAVAGAWVVFRADSLHQALGIWRGMIGLNGISNQVALCSPNISPARECIAGAPLAAWWLMVLLMVVWLMPNTQEIFVYEHPFLGECSGFAPKWLLYQTSVWWAIFTAIILSICLARLGQESQFIYYRF